MKTLLMTLAAVAVASTVAQADTITVGVYAPGEPFPSTAARVELASKLGDHFGKALGGTGVGKVYARAGDFAAAVKKGEVTVALVDATYLASSGGYTVIAEAVRNGESAHAWQLIAHDADKLAALKGKHVIVPSIGGRESDFVLGVLLGGEVEKGYFGKIDAAPDAASAAAAVGLGKADAAVVPASLDLPGGVTTVLKLGTVSGPVLVAYGNLTKEQKAALVSAAGSFSGDATIASLRGSDGSGVRSIAGRFSPGVKRGPLAVPAVRLLVGDLVEGRTFSIERTPVTSYVVTPVPSK